MIRQARENIGTPGAGIDAVELAGLCRTPKGSAAHRPRQQALAALAYSVGVRSSPSSRRCPFRCGDRAFFIWAEWCAGDADGRSGVRGNYRGCRRHPAYRDVRPPLPLGSAETRLAPMVALYVGWGYWRDLRICLRYLLQSRQSFATGMAAPKHLDCCLRIGRRGHNCKWPCMADPPPRSGLIYGGARRPLSPQKRLPGVKLQIIDHHARSRSTRFAPLAHDAHAPPSYHSVCAHVNYRQLTQPVAA
jgi:hypothetical protein